MLPPWYLRSWQQNPSRLEHLGPHLPRFDDAESETDILLSLAG